MEYEQFEQGSKRKTKTPKGRFLTNIENDSEIRIKSMDNFTRNCSGKNPKKVVKKPSKDE